MRSLRIVTVVLVTTALVVGGVPVEEPRAAAVVVVEDVRWNAHKGGWESQQIEVPSTMVGLTWDEARPLTTWYRVKRQGRWTGWLQLPVEDDHGPDASTVEGQRSRPGSDPVWLGASDAVQFRMTGRGSPQAQAILVDTKDLRRPALRKLTDFLAPRPPPASGAPSRPFIHARAEWDPTNSCEPKVQPDSGQITHFFVHHTAATNSYTQADVPGIILAICKFHRDSRGWNDIGYNFLIDKFGRIWEGRAGGIDKGIQAGHTQGFNSYSVGVAFIGTHGSAPPTASAEAALASLVAWKAAIHNVDTLNVNTVVSKGSNKWEVGTPVALEPISGHSDAQTTTCPGAACYQRLGIYRSRVNKSWKQVPITTYRSPLVADFDGDGRDEAAVFRTTDGQWLITEATGATKTWADFYTASGWKTQIVGDFDGDGRDDIANFHPSNGTWWVSRSTGSGFSTSLWADFSTAKGWSSQVVGDFNGDGRDDIANFHPSNGTWWVSRSTGSGFSTSLWADFSTPSGWTIQKVGDFDGDGRDDIANRHVGNGTWWTVVSDGNRFRSAALWGTTATRDHISHVWTQDVNADGRDDIMAIDAYNGFIRRQLSAGSWFDIKSISDTPWRTTVGGASAQRDPGGDGWLYFGQEFQWVRLTKLNAHPAGFQIVATLPRP